MFILLTSVANQPFSSTVHNSNVIAEPLVGASASFHPIPEEGDRWSPLVT